MPFKAMNLIIIVGLLALVIISFQRAYISQHDSSRVLIKGRGAEWIFPFEAEETIKIQGPLGITVVRIAGKNVWIEESPCVNQTCVAQGHISRQGSWVACLPNNVFALIEGGIPYDNVQSEEFDALSW